MKGKARGILDDDDTFFLELQYVSVFRQRADNPPERQQTSFPKLKRGGDEVECKAAHQNESYPKCMEVKRSSSSCYRASHISNLYELLRQVCNSRKASIQM